MYLLARKLGFADQMFKNIKVENGAVFAEDILREINRGGGPRGIAVSRQNGSRRTCEISPSSTW